jgi:hypothetical protein
MVLRTYFSKNNTIVKNSNVNSGLNPIAELFYGGSGIYSRFLFQIDETRLQYLYNDKTYPDLTKLKHTLRMINTGAFDKDLLNKGVGSKDRTTSFDLIVFKINQPWDNGTGYDLSYQSQAFGDYAFVDGCSNWFNPQSGLYWSGGDGVYSGSPSNITVGTQHFDKGNENIEIDVTDYVNGLLTGDTNNGLGLAFTPNFEATTTENAQYVGFFTNNTQTFYEPYIETVYESHIIDDRNDFYLDKPNKLYLYVNLRGNPTNLDILPSVEVFDNAGDSFTTYASSAVTQETKGVYSIDILVPTTPDNNCTMYNDVWRGLVINGVNLPDASLDFVIKSSVGYYNIGMQDSQPKKTAISVSGINSNEKIKRGDVRKVIVSARIPFTLEQTQKIDDLKYRLYVKEGSNELSVIDYQPVEQSINNYYFLLDTASLIPNTYYLDVLVTSNLETTTLANVINFDIVSQSDLRKSQ